MKKLNTNKRALFWPLVRLTLLFIIAQCVILYFNFKSVLGATPVNKFIMQQVIHSSKVIIGIGAFVGAQLLLNLCWILAVILCAYLIRILFNLTRSTYVSLGLLIWADSLIVIFLANQIFFPHSMFAFIFDVTKKLYPALQPYITPNGVHLTFFITAGLLSVAVALATISFLLQLVRNAKTTMAIILIAALGVGGFYYWKINYAPKPIVVTPTVKAGDKPNIILVSMDYFRPGDTTYFGNPTELTPNVDNILKQSTVFKHTITAIARTFPSLMTVESGSYPIKNGARFNLIDPTKVNHDMTMAHTLQNQGYYTMMATDGSHFFYMTKDYGYNQIVAPPPGLNEFLLSSINDFPLSNLVMNSIVGKYLFPYNYMNRNASFTYKPQTFNKELTRALAKRPDQPLYIHIHLTLAAWPYSWSSPTPGIPANLSKTERIHYRFNVGLKAVDQQFGQVMQILQQQHLLNNAMLVVFSDHGQAFGEPGDRITEKANLVGKASNADIYRFTQLNTSVGHGTDVLSMKQYHPLLAFKIYGGPPINQIGSRTLVTSLIDIAPTVLDYLHVANPGMQGISLMPEITAFPQTGLGDRPLFMETEFTLPSILTADPSIASVLNQGISYYDLNLKTGILQVKPMIGKLIIKGKQRAVIQGRWMLAFYPNSKGPGTLVLVNLATKQWTLDLSDAFAQTAPLQQMWQELSNFYGDEILMPTLPTPAAAASTATDTTPSAVDSTTESASAPTTTEPTATVQPANTTTPPAATTSGKGQKK
jgi:predicted RNA binding protein YcfA (HicA-like mRNA interferase family)